MARDNRLDTVKGLLIILVVLGHVIETWGGQDPVNHAVKGLIYIFHMPLFIIISGFFTKNPDNQRPRDFWRRTLGLVATLLIFQAISVLNVYGHGGNTILALKRFPFGVLWYLMGLIYWRIVLYYTPSALRKRPILYLGLAFVVTMLCGLTKLGNFLAIQRSLNFYFFFLLGYYYRQGLIPERWWKANKVHAAVAIVLLPLIFWLYPRCGNFMNGADHYTIQDLLQKFLIVACSVSVSLLVYNLTRENKWLAAIGKESLFYYVYHMFVISLVAKPILLYFDLPHTFPTMLLLTAITLLGVFLLSLVPLLRWLTRPTQPLKKSIKETSAN